jgi:hypothetical protein
LVTILRSKFVPSRLLHRHLQGRRSLVDIANIDQSRLFGDEEDIMFKEEETALSGFEIGFETWVPSRLEEA